MRVQFTLVCDSVSAWSNQGSVISLGSILNQWKLHGSIIYLSIYLIIHLEIWILMNSKWKYLLLLKLSEFYSHILKKVKNRTPLISMCNQTLLYYYLDTVFILWGSVELLSTRLTLFTFHQSVLKILDLAFNSNIYLKIIKNCALYKLQI